MNYFETLSYRILSFLFLTLILNISTYAQNRQTQFNGFGHIEFHLDKDENGNTASFVMGEHDFFITSTITDKISFLGEYVIRFNKNSPTNYLPSIERSLVKFNYVNNHSIIVGKIHTPVNYWNDVYHHGRVFFPVIDRPMAFNYLVPLHTLGLQFQGQNLGKLNFGYDVVIGNSINSTDVLNKSLIPSLTGSFHIKPKEGARIGMSYYWDNLKNNMAGVHSGHNVMPNIPLDDMYTGPVKLRNLSFSYAQFGERFELLSETVYNVSKTDSTGTARNYSQFIYTGLNLSEKSTPYALVDYINIADNDIHVYSLETFKVALGYKHSFNYLLNIKIQMETNWELRHAGHSHNSKYNGPSLRVQVAYGF
jgi:hypothetical protein